MSQKATEVHMLAKRVLEITKNLEITTYQNVFLNGLLRYINNLTPSVPLMALGLRQIGIFRLQEEFGKNLGS